MRLSPLLKMSAAAGGGGGGSTIVVGLNSALQKRFVLPAGSTLVPGNVHRAVDVQIGVGGKGQDVAMTLSCLGYGNGDVQAAQFIGSGPEGDQVYDMLVQTVGVEGMGLTVRPTHSGMRTCTSIVGFDSTTELVEPSGTIVPSELNELYDKLTNIPKATVSALCIMGSMPPGCPETTYADIYRAVAHSETICVIDSMSGLGPLIHEISNVKRGSTIFKVNASELAKLANVMRTSGASEVAGFPSNDVLCAVQQFLKHNPKAIQAFDAIAITDGAHPAYLATMTRSGFDEFNSDSECPFHLYQITIPSLQKHSDVNHNKNSVLFPIGAGDAVAAGTLAAWTFLTRESTVSSSLPSEIQTLLNERKNSIQIDDTIVNNHLRTLLTSFSFGLACGSASCLEEGNSVVDPQNVLSLFRQTTSVNEVTKAVFS